MLTITPDLTEKLAVFSLPVMLASYTRHVDTYGAVLNIR